MLWLAREVVEGCFLSREFLLGEGFVLGVPCVLLRGVVLLGVTGGLAMLCATPREVILIDAVESIELNLPFALPAGDALVLGTCLGEVIETTRDRGVDGAACVSDSEVEAEGCAEMETARTLRFGVETEGVRRFMGDTAEEGRLFCLEGAARTTDLAEVTEVVWSLLPNVGNAEGGAVMRRSVFDVDCIVLLLVFLVELEGMPVGAGVEFGERLELMSPFLFGGITVDTPLTSLANEAVEYARGLGGRLILRLR